MKTTLDLPDRILDEAKRRAARERRTLKEIFGEALRRYLHPPIRPRAPFQLRLLVKETGPQSGVDVADRDDLYDRMEDRR
ncbi:MAG: hypothetical protein HY608_03350 [Planctomycetes bacterium]|nr:hypothetical protein [Planctomycetota bacterium]